MITAKDAIETGRALLGTPYATLDCIGFIVRIIRTAPGGDAKYTTAGTNSMWRSYTMSEKYRDLTWRQEGIFGARAGMLAFKRSGDDVHHVGLVTGEGTVLHSSSAKGCVIETAMDSSWALLAVHRYIEIEELGKEEQENMEEEKAMYQARVATKNDPLNLREQPAAGSRKIGELPRGAMVDVLDTAVNAGWWRVRYGALVGYASSDYLQHIDTEVEAAESVEIADGVTAETIEATTLVREDGEGTITLFGRWRVAQD